MRDRGGRGRGRGHDRGGGGGDRDRGDGGGDRGGGGGGVWCVAVWCGIVLTVNVTYKLGSHHFICFAVSSTTSPSFISPVHPTVPVS